MHLYRKSLPSGSDFGKNNHHPGNRRSAVVGVAATQAALFDQICTKDGDLKNNMEPVTF
jgi:glycerol kinase